METAGARYSQTRCSSCQPTKSVKSLKNKLCAWRHTMPPPLLPVGAQAPCAPPSRRNVAVLSHAEYVSTLTAAAALCVKAALSKAAWWPCPFDLESGVRVTCDVGYLCANFGLPRPLCSRLRPDVRDVSDRQTSDRYQTKASLNASALTGRGIKRRCTDVVRSQGLTNDDGQQSEMQLWLQSVRHFWARSLNVAIGPNTARTHDAVTDNLKARRQLLSVVRTTAHHCLRESRLEHFKHILLKWQSLCLWGYLSTSIRWLFIIFPQTKNEHWSSQHATCRKWQNLRCACISKIVQIIKWAVEIFRKIQPFHKKCTFVRYTLSHRLYLKKIAICISFLPKLTVSESL